jgi:hypothetical protein
MNISSTLSFIYLYNNINFLFNLAQHKKETIMILSFPQFT